DDKTEDLSPDPPVSEASFSDSSFSEWSPSRASIASSGSSSDSTIILKSTRARKRQTLEGPPDSTVARDVSVFFLIYMCVCNKFQTCPIWESNPGRCNGSPTLYRIYNVFSGGSPPTKVRILYALGIIMLFPNLKDPDSKNGYEFQTTRKLQHSTDFTLLFGEELSGKFLARWPTFFKPRIISDCKNLAQSAHLTDLLLSAQKIDGGGKNKLDIF
uniref:Uncharacterized protein n=1 Tax=Gouania willdenowi TaxID=441366 RepID=A0A8C5GYC5_GOUWI